MNDEISAAIDIMQRYATVPRIFPEHSQTVANIVDRYFGDFQRNQNFRNVERCISPRFNDLLSHFDHENGVSFATQYFLFCYTLAQDYKLVQHSIYENVALPYEQWVLQKWNFFEPAVKKINVGGEYVFVCRHAVTRGGYAPGSSVFTFAKALLRVDRKVTILSFGEVSEDFEKLSDEYQNCNVMGLEQSSPTGRLLALIEIFKLLKPRAVLTEIEFDVPSVFSILRPNIPVIYLSPGYYNLPWYDKIGLTDSLSLDPIGSRKKDFFEIPTYVANEILDPTVSKEQVKQVKKSLGIRDGDFVIGSFARMEKFQEPFLKVLHRVLEESDSVKVLLAGPNDRSRVETSLDKFIKSGRALILPSSDAHVLGHCLNLGVDTFPTHSGFSVLELMAKGIPVVAKQDREMDANWRQRLPASLRKDDNSLIELILELATNPETYCNFCEETKKFMVSDGNDKKFISSIDRALQHAYC
jgi:glycosyltransferase involved in cell wall biosynthesis